MSSIKTTPIKLCLASKCIVPQQSRTVGEVCAGFEMKGFNLTGKTGIKEKAYYTEGLNACTGGVVIGKKINMFHENSSIYDNAEHAKRKIFPEITKKITKMAQETKEKIQVGLFGGWGYGSNKNIKEVDKSHNLFNNIALCIEEDIPQKEGLNIPLLTVWGKRDSKISDSVYARGNTIVLISDIFKSLFNKGECKLDRDGLIKFLENHYEEVLIPNDVNVVAKEVYDPIKIFWEHAFNKKPKSSV